MEITIYHYLFLAMLIFTVGICGIIISKNIIKILISIEIMLCGINLNFVTFSTYCDSIKLNGDVFVLFYIATGAIELSLALYIFYLMYKTKQSENIENYGDL